MKGHVISLHVKILPLLQRCLPVDQRSTMVYIGYVAACTPRAISVELRWFEKIEIQKWHSFYFPFVLVINNIINDKY